MQEIHNILQIIEDRIFRNFLIICSACAIAVYNKSTYFLLKRKKNQGFSCCAIEVLSEVISY